MSKSTYERQLDSIESRLGKTHELIKKQAQEKTDLQKVLVFTDRLIDEWLLEIHELRSNLKDVILNWGDKSNEVTHERMVFNDRITRMIHRPSQLNMLLQYVDLYEAQSRNSYLSKDLKFATKIISNLLSRLQLAIDPIVIFGTGFYAYDADSDCIFVVPYSNLHSYEKWVNLAHEVGHLYVRKRCQLDKEKLGRILIEKLGEHSKHQTMQIKESQFQELILKLIVWTDNWAHELVSDSVAIFLCGIAYLTETIFYSTGDIFEEGSASHPPTSFRLAIQIEILERLGIDVSSVEHYRTNLTDQTDDNLTKTLISLNIVPDIVNWILSHKCISNLESSWNEIRDAVKGIREGEKPTMAFEVAFAALAYLTPYFPTEQGFQFLREKSQ